MKKIKQNLKLEIKSWNWRRRNKHNYTFVGNRFPGNSSNIKVGNYSYGPLNVHSFGNPKEHLEIGHFCSIASGVKFLLGGEHAYENLSTYPFKEYFTEEKEHTYTKGPVIIKDDVWIGEDVLILSGVTIGQGAIIGARAIVSKDIPPYAIYANNKIIKYRFNKDIINKLLDLDYAKMNNRNFNDLHQYLYTELDIQNARKIQEILKSSEAKYE